MPSSILGGELAPLFTAKKGDTLEISGIMENIKREKITIDDKFPVKEIFPIKDEIKSKSENS